MQILIIPNSFKGSLPAKNVAQNLAAGMLKVKPNLLIKKMPIADGGTGTLEIIKSQLKYKLVSIKATDPLGKKIKAEYGIIHKKKVAIIELARIAGLHLIKQEMRNPLKTTTFGVGELIKDSMKRGCTRIILGVGDSATIDCGIGAMSALGIKFLDRHKKPVEWNCSGLLELHSIKNPINNWLKNIEFIVLVDVQNILTGKNGALVYAPQKGATKKDLFIINRGLRNFKKVILKQYNIDLDKIEGAGAAGGIAGGMHAILNAKIISGFDYFFRITRLKDAINNADLVITGEGKIDKTTFYGKATGKIIDLCRTYRRPLILVCGTCSHQLDYGKYGIKSIYCLTKGSRNERYAIKNAADLLIKIGSEIARTI
ncbi:MAG: glycerate kinase family protein [bacterium]